MFLTYSALGESGYRTSGFPRKQWFTIDFQVISQILRKQISLQHSLIYSNILEIRWV